MRIGDVAARLGVQPHVLRYWEREFAQLKPQKGRGGQRLYDASDVALLERIKDLVHNRGFTIAGAKKALRAERSGEPRSLAALIAELKAIRDSLRDSLKAVP